MSYDIEDQLRQHYRDSATSVGGDPSLVSKAVHTGTARRRRRRGAAVGAAVAASLGLVLAVPAVQSAMTPEQRVPGVPASVPTPMLPRIATSTWQIPPGSRPMGTKGGGISGPLGLSKDGGCLAIGQEWLMVWPKGYTVARRAGHVTVLDQAGAKVARVGDVITVWSDTPGDQRRGPGPANGCGLRYEFNIQSKVTVGPLKPGVIQWPPK
jgi:hypothetical protein